MSKSIGRIISILSRKIQQDLKDVVSPFGINVGEEPYFMTLVNEDGLTQDELTKRVMVDKAATTRAVKSLEEKGFIIRKIDSADKISKRLYLTSKGKEIAEPLRSALWTYNQSLTKDWTDEQYEEIYNALLQLLNL